MILMFVLLVLCVVICVVFIWLGQEGGYEIQDGATFVGIVAGVIALVLICVNGFMVFAWTSAKYKAQIINREYGTEYTRDEVFYASDVINTIRELDRRRIELNGNILGGSSNGN